MLNRHDLCRLASRLHELAQDADQLYKATPIYDPPSSMAVDELVEAILDLPTYCYSDIAHHLPTFDPDNPGNPFPAPS